MSGSAAPAAPVAQGLTAERLGDVVGRLVRMLRRVQVAPLGSSAMSALATVVGRGPVRLGELAEIEGVTPATLSRVVNVLEGHGFVERRTDPDDRRAAFLLATPAGTASVEQLRSVRGAALAARIERLSPQERATLEAGLEVLDRLTSG